MLAMTIVVLTHSEMFLIGASLLPAIYINFFLIGSVLSICVNACVKQKGRGGGGSDVRQQVSTQ